MYCRRAARNHTSKSGLHLYVTIQKCPSRTRWQVQAAEADLNAGRHAGALLLAACSSSGGSWCATTLQLVPLLKPQKLTDLC